jgi:FixJ family two-component response regulator
MTDSLAPIIHVIDDEASLRTALARLLIASGYRVAIYESAAQFLERPFTQESGCILLDNNMPGLTGMQLQAHLNKEHNALPIIFLTGQGDIAMSVRAIKSGAEDFLSKPVQKADLLEAVQRALVRFDAANKQQMHLQDGRRRISLLTAREKEVFDLLILGMLNKQIAFKLGNTERTVKAHRHSIMEKMEVASLAELVLIAAELGLLDDKDV